MCGDDKQHAPMYHTATYTDYDFGRGILYRILSGENAHSQRTYYYVYRVVDDQEILLRSAAFVSLFGAEGYMLKDIAKDPNLLRSLLMPGGHPRTH